MDMHKDTVRNVLNSFYAQGDVWPPEHYQPERRGPVSVLDDFARGALQSFVEANPHMYIDELGTFVHEYDTLCPHTILPLRMLHLRGVCRMFGLDVSDRTISRALQEAGFTRKKLTKVSHMLLFRARLLCL
jgi:hypothetical protein